MYTIYVYTPNVVLLFQYKSNILPMVGDVYPGTDIDQPNYKVIKRLLHTAEGTENIISIWAEKTLPA
jgi:hypothetical protein